MSLYAYIRKDYPASTLDQLKILQNYKCTEVFIEEVDLASNIELEKMFQTIKPEDQIVIYDLRTFAMNSRDFRELLKRLKSMDIRLISLQDSLDTQTSTDFYSNVLMVLNMKEKHRKFVIHSGFEQARLEGRILGRPRVEDDVISRIAFLSNKKGKSMREIAEICQVSLGTVHKYVKESNKA